MSESSPDTRDTAVPVPPIPRWWDHTRFEMRTELGVGAMGHVYSVLDRLRQEVVALKTFHDVDPLTLYHLKSEFRTLADVSHPNLVQLYELVMVGSRPCITMELVQGIPFLEYVRGHEGINAKSWEAVATHRSQSHLLGPADSLELIQGPNLPSSVPLPEEAYPRLRTCLLPLAEAVLTLHGVHVLHRDIKPSNVLVHTEGRPVLLDFGLAIGVEEANRDRHGVSGTLPYMAPEQAAALPQTEASDWYSFGVLIYEALCGHPPFTGEMGEILTAKLERDAPLPSRLVGTVPEDLEQLTMDLLQRQPEDRPDGAEVVTRLGGSPATIRPMRIWRGDGALYGRETHLRQLREAWRQVKGGEAVLCLLHGSSGMGKSALLTRFLDEIRAQAEALILVVQCVERDSTPFRALDPLMDQLSSWMAELSGEEVAQLMPTHSGALMRLFPELRAVPAFSYLNEERGPTPDPRAERQRAAIALRELLSQVARRYPLVLFFDDLQWGDVGSGELLSALFEAPIPPFLMVASHRTDEAPEAPILRVLRKAFTQASARPPLQLELGPLEAAEAQKLALELLTEDSQEEIITETINRQAQVVVEAAAGSPFFLNEFGHFARQYLKLGAMGLGSPGPAQQPKADGKDTPSPSNEEQRDRAETPALEPVRLQDFVQERLKELPAEARVMLELVCLAGQPLSRGFVAQVFRQLEVDSTSPQRVINALSAGRWLRSEGPDDDHLIQIYHDRLRAPVVEGIPKEMAEARHLVLAETMAKQAAPELEFVAIHYVRAGRGALAATPALEAAREAVEAYAFERAGYLYRLALSHLREEDSRYLTTLEALGETLEHGGRGAEAARRYLQAARLCHDDANRRSWSLVRRAAAGLLNAGYLERGVKLTRRVLFELGVPVPGRRSLLLASLLLARLWRRISPLRVHLEPGLTLDWTQQQRLDALFFAATHLGHSDTVLAAFFGVRFIREALSARHPSYLAQAMALEAFFSHVEPGGHRRSVALTRRAEVIARDANSPAVLSYVLLYRGIIRAQFGDYSGAAPALEEAARIIEEECVGMAGPLGWARFLIVGVRFARGELSEARELHRWLIRDVVARDDKALEVRLRVGHFYLPDLVDDRPDVALVQVAEALEGWRKTFDLQHAVAATSRCRIALYQGDAQRAWDELEVSWPQIVGSDGLVSLFYRRWFASIGATVALAAVASGVVEKRRGLRRARAFLRILRWMGDPSSRASREVGLAAMAAMEGRVQEAVRRLETAETALERLELPLYREAVRLYRGRLLQHTEVGSSLITETREAMKTRGVTAPDRWSRSLVPMTVG